MEKQYTCLPFSKLIALLVILILVVASCESYRMPEPVNIDPGKDRIYKSINRVAGIQVPVFNEAGKMYFFGKLFGLMRYYNSTKNQHRCIADFTTLFEGAMNCAGSEQYAQYVEGVISRYFEPEAIKAKADTQAICWDTASLYLSRHALAMLNNVYAYYNKTGIDVVGLEQSNIGRISYREESNLTDYRDRSARLYQLYAYWNLVNYFSANRDLFQQDWDTALYESTQAFAGAQNREQYLKAILHLVHCLHDSHGIVAYQVYDEIWGTYELNARFVKLGDSFVVSAIPVSQWATPDIQVGDLLLSVNGQSASSRFEELSAYFSYANTSAQNKLICKYLAAGKQQQSRLVLRRGNNIKEVYLKAYHYRDIKQHSEGAKLREQYKGSDGLRWLVDSIVCTGLDYLTDDNIESAIRSMSKAKGIVLDLRGYPEDKVFFSLCDFLLPAGTRFFRSYYTDLRFPALVKQSPGYTLGNPDSTKVFRGKTVLIVDGSTQSMAEFLCMALQKANGVITIGEQTAGADGNVSSFMFNDEFKTTFSGIGIVYPDQSPTQVLGVKIDYTIHPSYTSICRGEDTLLSFASSLLSSSK